MKKNRIRLTESDLHRIVKESVNMVLKEAVATGPKRFDDVDPYNEIDITKISHLLGDLSQAVRDMGIIETFNGYKTTNAKFVKEYKNALYSRIKEMYKILNLLDHKNLMSTGYHFGGDEIDSPYREHPSPKELSKLSSNPNDEPIDTWHQY